MTLLTFTTHQVITLRVTALGTTSRTLEPFIDSCRVRSYWTCCNSVVKYSSPLPGQCRLNAA